MTLGGRVGRMEHPPCRAPARDARLDRVARLRALLDSCVVSPVSAFCAFCRLARRATPDALSGRAAVVRLLNDAHNEVNARLGKRVWTLREHYEVYSLERAAARRVERVRRRHRAVTLLVIVGLAAAWQLHCQGRKKMMRH